MKKWVAKKIPTFFTVKRIIVEKIKTDTNYRNLKKTTFDEYYNSIDKSDS